MSRPGIHLAVPLLVALLQVGTATQDRLRSMPGYDRFQAVSPQLADAVRSGSLSVNWSADARTFDYVRDGRLYRFDVAARRAFQIGAGAEPATRGGPPGLRGGAHMAPERGRQHAFADSPDSTLRAQYRDRNLFLLDLATGSELALTTDGSGERRIKYGTASWVYGEELEQTTAMWWSPDGRKLAFYRFDESGVSDYHLQLDQTRLLSAVETEAYPKAGTRNPLVDLLVYDVQTKKSITLDVRSGKPFDNSVVGHYVYRVSWTPDGRELLFHRTNRRQNILELVAADAGTGALRVVLREEWPDAWVESNPAMVFLKDGRRFIWESERNGWKNYYLYDLSGRLITPLTTHTTFEVAGLTRIDEDARLLFYMARDGDNHLKLQLHRVGLDGQGDVRLTDPKLHHTVGGCAAAVRLSEDRRSGGCGISPDNRFFVDVYQTHETPAGTRLVNAMTGEIVADIAAPQTGKFDQLGLKKAEMFTYKSADGQTTLHGLIQFPSDFDPSRRYPVLVPVYAGPGSPTHTARETFVAPNPLAEFGFLIVTLDSRSAPGRGKRTLDQVYLRLGQVEVDDIAAGVRALAARPYIDATRVGIFGTSYGGYTAVMSLLRHPDLYAAASALSPVTAWTHYDTIYTERYMRMPQENKAGYEAGSAMPYVRNLKGRLMLYYGTADNNVHPSNVMQLMSALQAAGKSFDVQVGPDRGHTGINTERMMEFFIETLLLRPAAAATF